MAEIEIDMNQRIGEWATLTESGSRLVPLYGKGYTGFDNLGNTCYMNSVMQVNNNIRIFISFITYKSTCINNQVVFSLPSFARGYVDGAPAVFAKANLYDPMSDFRLQVNVKFCQKRGVS